MRPDREEISTHTIARLAVGVVFAVNIACAAVFILRPEAYAPGFEVGGVPGKAVVQGMGILILMWNVPYAAFILKRQVDLALLAIILIQQVIGLVGESWLYLGLPPGHAALQATGLRFIVFDALGLVWMGAAYWVLHRSKEQPGLG